MGGGGTTTTSGVIPPELQGLYRGSANQLLSQQKNNDIGQYNAANPQQTAPVDPLQQYGMSLFGAGANPSGIDSLALQSILREPGLAGAGPTTGQYNYGSEAGLGDLMSFMGPQTLQGAELGAGAQGTGGTQGYSNAAPGPNQAPGDYSGLSAALAPPPAPPGGQGGILPTGNDGAYAGGSDLQHPLPGSYGGQGLGDFLSSGGPQGPAKFGAPPAGYQSEFSKQQHAALGDPMKGLQDAGFSVSSAPGGAGTTFSKNGQSYTNVGASHEGAGYGGETKFLQGLGYDSGPMTESQKNFTGVGGGGAYGGEAKQLDKQMAAVAQGNLNQKVRGLTTADKQAMAASGKDIFGNTVAKAKA